MYILEFTTLFDKKPGYSNLEEKNLNTMYFTIRRMTVYLLEC